MKKLLIAMLLMTVLGSITVNATLADYNLNHGEHRYETSGETTYLLYTSMRNVGRDNEQYGHVYFTVDSDVPAGKELAVQFLATDISIHGSIAGRENFAVTDYGIYLFDPIIEDPAKDIQGTEHELWSVKDSNNYFKLNPGQSFGVYYTTQDGVVHKSTYVENKTGNYVSNWDNDPHEITYVDEDGIIRTETTNKHFMCMFDSRKLVWPHWEFMLETTLDNPYFPPPRDEEQVVGQPLPGTLATLLISGLCTAALRKKNKKRA